MFSANIIQEGQSHSHSKGHYLLGSCPLSLLKVATPWEDSGLPLYLVATHISSTGPCLQLHVGTLAHRLSGHLFSPLAGKTILSSRGN